MSEEIRCVVEGGSQAAIEAEAAERLIARLHDLNWNAQKQVELEAWLAESVAHEVAYLRLEAGWNGADRLAVLRASSQRPTLLERPRPSGGMKIHVAAVFLISAVIGTFGYVFSRPSNGQVFVTPVGGRETITLLDGSQIELNTQSELRLPAGSRSATLVRGEAYFQIHHDPVHLFTLNVGDRRIVDLGTKFVVRQRPDQLEVTLVEGRARIESASNANDQKAAVLTPGDVAVATRGHLTVTRKPPSALADALSWRSGLLVFHHTTLREAADELNRYNAKQIIVADENTARRVFGGKFHTDNSERFADVASAALGLNVHHNGSEIVISGNER